MVDFKSLARFHLHDKIITVFTPIPGAAEVKAPSASHNFNNFVLTTPPSETRWFFEVNDFDGYVFPDEFTLIVHFGFIF